MSHVHMQLVLTNHEGKTVSLPLDASGVDFHRFLLCGTTLTPDPEQILRSSRTTQGIPVLTLGVTPINDEKAVFLAQSARQLLENPVWSIITSSVIEHAREQSIKFAEHPHETVVYKAMQSLVEYQTSLAQEFTRFAHRGVSGKAKERKTAKGTEGV